MKPNNQLKEYRRVMDCITVDDAVKEQIIKNCALHSTLKRIKSTKYKVIAVAKEKTTENA